MYVQLQNFGSNSSIKSTYHEGRYECIERIHQFPEIVYIIDGSVEITVDGKIETAKKGDLAVITPFRAHSFHTPDYCSIWIGVVSNDFVSDFISGDRFNISGERAVFTPSASLSLYVTEHFPTPSEKHASLSFGDVQYRGVKALVYAVFEEYTRLIPQINTHRKKNALSSILTYMSEHYRENIDLVHVSATLGYTPGYVSHCVMNIPNMSFRKLLNSLRVDHAKNLLISTDYKMIDVAMESGFATERSFYRAFVDIVGKTPNAYRNTNG